MSAMDRPIGASGNEAETNLHCNSCGKRISYAQSIFWANKNWCLDSILTMLGNRPETEGERVNISVDLLERLRDGVI